MNDPIVIAVQIANETKLIIVQKFRLFLIKYFTPMTKKNNCAIRNGIVNNSRSTPIKTKSIS